MLAVAAAEGFKLDAVQMPVSVIGAHGRGFEKQDPPEFGGQGIAVLGMKSRANGILLKSNTVTAIECLREGAFDYVLKPFKIAELIQIIARVLRRRRRMIARPPGLRMRRRKPWRRLRRRLCGW